MCFLTILKVVFIEPKPLLGFPGGSDDKESTCNAGDLGSIPGLGRSPGEGHGSPLQCSCPENSMDRGAWRATVHGVRKSQTQLTVWAYHSIESSCWGRKIPVGIYLVGCFTPSTPANHTDRDATPCPVNSSSVACVQGLCDLFAHTSPLTHL